MGSFLTAAPHVALRGLAAAIRRACRAPDSTCRSVLLAAALAAGCLQMTVAGGAEAQTSPELGDVLDGLTYREIGPALMGGRIADLAVVESRPQTFFLGTASGGVWRTDNHGTSWTPLFDDQSTSSIGAIAVDQSNPNLLWVGTGDRRTANRLRGATACTAPGTGVPPGRTWVWTRRSTSVGS